MSIQAVGWVLDNSTTTGGERLVLISLANHADENLECYPTVARITREAGIKDTRTTQKILARLESAGHITRVLNGAFDPRIRADRRPTLYKINGVVPQYTPQGPPDAPRGVLPCADGVYSEYTQTISTTVTKDLPPSSQDTNSCSTASLFPSDEGKVDLLHQLVRESFKQRKDAGKPFIQPFVHILAVARSAYKNGATLSDIGWCLSHARTHSTAAWEWALNERREREAQDHENDWMVRR